MVKLFILPAFNGPLWHKDDQDLFLLTDQKIFSTRQQNKSFLVKIYLQISNNWMRPGNGRVSIIVLHLIHKPSRYLCTQTRSGFLKIWFKLMHSCNAGGRRNRNCKKASIRQTHSGNKNALDIIILHNN